MDTIKTLNPLIDCDPITYAAPAAAESQIKKECKEKGWSPEQIAEYVEATDFTAHALSNVRTAMDFILEEAFPERKYFKAYLTGKGNFRFDVATILPYKGNRDKLARPKYYAAAREYLVNKYNADVIEGQEADDAMGIYQFSHPDKSTVICSIDKDLWQIPGYHYVPSTGYGDNRKEPRFFYQNIDDANLYFWYQMMCGDRVDNIPGLKGVGPKTAEKIIAELNGDLGLIEQRVRDMYLAQWPDNPGAISEIAQLLWMRRREGEGPNV